MMYSRSRWGALPGARVDGRELGDHVVEPCLEADALQDGVLVQRREQALQRCLVGHQKCAPGILGHGEAVVRKGARA